jgi:hypothetical protein
VAVQVQGKNQQFRFVLGSLTFKASDAVETHKVIKIHVIRDARRIEWPAMAHFTVGIKPQSTGIEVSCLMK